MVSSGSSAEGTDDFNYISPDGDIRRRLEVGGEVTEIARYVTPFVSHIKNYDGLYIPILISCCSREDLWVDG